LPVLALMNARFPETHRQPAGKMWRLPRKSAKFESAMTVK
jgi:hypothetical protein